MDGISWGLFLIACVGLAFIMSSVTIGVVMRYFLNRPLNWVVEVVSYSLVFLTFLSAAWLVRKNKHVTIDLIFDRLNPRVQALLNITIYSLIAIVWLVIAWYSAQSTWQFFQSWERIDMTLLEPPRAPLMVVVPLGTFLLFIECLRRVRSSISGWRALSEEKRAAGKHQTQAEV